MDTHTVESVRARYEEKVAGVPGDLARWGYFDREQVGVLLREVERLAAAVADYENGISWDTTCLNCAKLWDTCYGETCRADKAEAELARLRAEREETGGGRT